MSGPDVSSFVQFAAGILEPVLDRPGKVLYSEPKTLRRGERYILAMNPGQAATRTIRADLLDFPSKSTNDHLDESWISSKGRRLCPVGRHPLQRHLNALCESLGFRLRDTCASNLIFTTSHQAKDAGYPESADQCWPVHQRILDVVQPRAIFAIGNGAESPFRYLTERARAKTPIEQEPVSRGKASCKAILRTIHDRPTVVIGLPHLSRFTIEGKPQVIDWIRKQIDRVR